jgi:outer membrane lipoprotein-sorting protein
VFNDLAVPDRSRIFMPHHRRITTFAALLLTLPAVAVAQGNLDKALAQMDTASAKFQSAQADLRRDSYERVVRETTTQHGSVYFQRVGGGTEMGLKIDDTGAQKILQYRNGVLDIFSPGTNQIDEFKDSGQADAFLSIGFGGKGSDLAKSWNITDMGPESISVDGKNVQTEKLDLVPKDASAKNNFSHVTIWVDLTRDISLKQQFFQPSGDTNTSTYSNIRYNQKVDTGAYAIKKNTKTTVMRH